MKVLKLLAVQGVVELGPVCNRELMVFFQNGPLNGGFIENNMQWVNGPNTSKCLFVWQTMWGFFRSLTTAV